MAATTIVTIASSDLISNSRTDINSNFASILANKVETDAIDVDTTLAANSDTKVPSQKATKAYIDNQGNNLAPTGAITAYAAATAPTGWLLADGTAVSRATYSALFTVISTTYGAGNGTTTFNVPNLKGKIPVGFNSAETEFDVLGETGGEKTHVLTVAELAAHAHTLSIASEGTTGNNGIPGKWGTGVQSSSSNVTLFDTTIGGANSVGSNTAHNNLQPYLTLLYIIKT